MSWDYLEELVLIFRPSYYVVKKDQQGITIEKYTKQISLMDLVVIVLGIVIALFFYELNFLIGIVILLIFFVDRYSGPSIILPKLQNPNKPKTTYFRLTPSNLKVEEAHEEYFINCVLIYGNEANINKFIGSELSYQTTQMKRIPYKDPIIKYLNYPCFRTVGVINQNNEIKPIIFEKVKVREDEKRVDHKLKHLYFFIITHFYNFINFEPDYKYILN